MKPHKDERTAGRTIEASAFETVSRDLMDEIAETGEGIVVTRNGRPVWRLAPHREPSGPWFGRDRDKIRVLGDIVSPMPAEWFEEADSDEHLS